VGASETAWQGDSIPRGAAVEDVQLNNHCKGRPTGKKGRKIDRHPMEKSLKLTGPGTRRYDWPHRIRSSSREWEGEKLEREKYGGGTAKGSLKLK